MAVIGAGWAGCAAAVEATMRGHRVHLFEAARQLGGRARSLRREAFDPAAVTDQSDPADPMDPRDAASPANRSDAQWESALDNGQHILLGAYTQSLRLMRAVGVDIEKSLLRLPLQMRYPAGSGGMDLVSRPLPAPLHLLAALWQAKGLARADKMALVRFTSLCRWIDWRLNDDCSVSDLLARFDQTERVVALLWRPLCLAALNTPPERASAQVFLNVLRDSLGARRRSSDMLVPRCDLSALFPVPAARFLVQAGGYLHAATRVQGLIRAGERWSIACAGGSLADGASDTSHASNALPLFDAVILATPHTESERLLAGLVLPDAVLDFSYEPITTCYLRYAPEIALALPLYALLDDPAQGLWGQFVFDRGQLDAAQRGTLAVVISAASEAIMPGRDALGAAIVEQLASAFANPAFRQPLQVKIITEKRATFSCLPALVRPSAATGVAGLVRAGDHVAGDYPATLEGAVRSGIAAVDLL
ncbi:MAG: FAD-dependent oxidoreductase [Herminiimonas sp.]|nr:FAD-dependent oxidoreductase [Herminiimonas sp.]